MFKKSAKQLDKLSQWTGETFFKEGKTELSPEFREFEKEVELRKNGIERLHATSIPYHAGLAKKKPTPDPYPTDSHSAKEKILAGEALGLVMISHGEDLQNASRGYGGISGEGGKLGEMLEKFGRGRCRVAAAQEEFTNRLGENYVAGMENALGVVKEYLAQRKKLDSKRLALDAATRKMNTSKKENRGLEEEVNVAQARYEEAQEDTHSRMVMVQDCEAQQMAELTDFLEAEMEFVQSYYEILSELKSDWERSGSSATSRPRSKSTSAVPKAQAPAPSRTTSSSRLSSMLGGGRPALPSRQNSSKPTSDDDANGNTRGNRDRAFSNASASSKKEKKSSFIPKFGSMGKKSTIVSSGLGSKERYGSLDDREGLRDGSEHEVGRLGLPRDVDDSDEDNSDDDRYGRKETYGRASPAVAYASGGRSRSHSDVSGAQARFVAGNAPTARTSTPPFKRTITVPAHNTIAESRESHEEGRALVKVLYDYEGKAADELSIRVGDIVEVTRTVSTDWCIGENERGESGLFPSTYTEPYDASSTVKKAPPALPSRTSSSLAIPTEGARRTPPVFGAPMPGSRSPGGNYNNNGSGRLAPPIVTRHASSDTETDEDPFN